MGICIPLSLESPNLPKEGSMLPVRRRGSRLRKGARAGNQDLLTAVFTLYYRPWPLQSEAGGEEQTLREAKVLSRPRSRVMLPISKTRQSHPLVQGHACIKCDAGMTDPGSFALARPLPPDAEGRGLETPRLLHPLLSRTWCSPGSSTRARKRG